MIKISGRERSGTTWLEMLLRQNYICGKVDTRLKHHFTGNLYNTPVKTIVISKHPLDWWYSYYLYTMSSDMRLEDMPTALFGSWCHLYDDWLYYGKNHDVSFIRYQDLYNDPEGTLDAIGLVRSGREFDRVEKTVSANGEITSDEFSRDMSKRIEAYKQAPTLVDALSGIIDREVMDDLGYHSFDLEEN